MHRFVLLLVALLAFAGTGSIAGVAQPATPVADGGASTLASSAVENRPDLAAMALTAADLPPGFVNVDERYFLTAQGVSTYFTSQVVTPDEIVASGMLSLYDSFYTADADGSQLYLAIAEFASPEDVEGWFALYEDETRVPASIDVLSRHALPGPEIGEASGESTVAVVEIHAVGGQLVTQIGIAFRIDTLYVLVQLQTPAEIDTSGTPAATPAPDPQRVRLTNDVAASLVARIEAVRAGQEVDGADQSLAPLMLPIDQAWPYPGVAVEGYKDAPQVLGASGPSAAFVDAFEGGYSRTAYPGTGPDDLYPVAPTVTVSLSRFTSPEAAMGVLEGAIPGPLAPQVWQQVETQRISGADASRTYRSAYRPGGPVDSARVALVTGDHVVTVDVQGAMSEAAARSIAEDLAAQQAVCVMAGTSCRDLRVPDTRGAGAEGTPAAATPAQGDDGIGITVLEPDESYAGVTLDEWNARFWQWLVTLPIAVNPFFEPTGEYCGYGNSDRCSFSPGCRPTGSP